MLPKKERFSTSDFSLIKSVKSEKIPTSIGVFSIYKSIIPAKFTIVLSKKNFKTAVSRNKHKRIFFNLIQSLRAAATPPLLNFSVSFYPKKSFDKDELLHAIISFK